MRGQRSGDAQRDTRIAHRRPTSLPPTARRSSTMIINADDFGYSSSVNAAILKAFEEGLVSSTTVMANMPAFEEACAAAHERKLLGHVGAHLVLTEGETLTEPIRRCRRFC